MKKRIYSLLVTLVLAVSVILGVSIFASAESTDGLKASAISLAENVTLKMEVAITDPTDGAYAKITLPNGEVDATQLVAAAPKNGDNFVFFAEVAVKDLSKNVTLEICKADGSTLVAATTTTALAYCNSYTSGEFLGLVGALKAYAEAADYYFDGSKSAESASTADFTSVADVAVSGKLPAGITHRSATLLLESETTIRHYFELEEGKKINSYTFYVDIDKDGKCDLNEKIVPKTKATDDGTTVYFVEIAGLTPNQLDDIYTVGVTDGTDTYTCDYGVLTYAKRSYANGSVELKDLAAKLFAYSTEAGKLKGTVTFDANGGSAVANQSYEYGVAFPIVAPTDKAGATFLGWTDAAGKVIDTIPSSATGTVALTAKWSSSKTVYDASSQKTEAKHYCYNHKDTSDPADKICDTCGYCVDNESCTLVNAAATAKCTTCGNAQLATSGKLSGLSTSGSDKGQGYAYKMTDTNGKEVMLYGVNSKAFYQNFNGVGNKTLASLAADSKIFAATIEVGMPTAEQYQAVEQATTGSLGGEKANFVFRISGAGGTDTLFTVSGGKAYISNDSSKAVTLPDGKVTKLTIVFDFTGAVAGDKTQDSYTVMLYNEAGSLVNAKTVSLQQKVYQDNKTGAETTSNKTDNVSNTHIYTGDISKYSSYFFQFRTTGAGRFLLGDIDALDYNPFAANDVFNGEDNSKMGSYTLGVAYELPETLPDRDDGSVFGGWYADAKYTQAIDKVGANAVGPVTVYPLWLHTYGINNDPSIAAGQIYFEDNTYLSCYDFDSDGECDACGACLHLGALVNAICESCGNKVVQDCDKKGHADNNSDGWCDNCHYLVTRSKDNHPAPANAQAVDGIFMGTGNQIGANVVIVDNGNNDYYKVSGMGGGPSFNAQSDISMEDLLNASVKLGLGMKVSFSIQLARVEGTATAGMSLRTRSYRTVDGTNTANQMDIMTVGSNGQVTFASTGGALKSGSADITLSTTMKTIDVVFDFEAHTVTYYVDGEVAAVYANSNVCAVYDAESCRYETTGWYFDGTGDNALNGRINNIGITLIGDTITVAGDITEQR